MYAIVSTGGKQYKVAEGDVIDVEKLDGQPGDKVTLDVLMLSRDGEVTVDASELEGITVEAEVLEQLKGKKVLVFKLKKRKRYHRTKGHRQNLTKLKIVAIGAGNESDAVVATASSDDTPAAADADETVDVVVEETGDAAASESEAAEANAAASDDVEAADATDEQTDDAE